MKTSPSRQRGIWKAAAINGSLVLVSLLFAAGVAELAVRIAVPQQLIQIRPDLWQPVDTLGWMHKPNVRTTINTGERTVSVITDSAGFRVSATGRVENGLPVLLLGDSFMEALQVEYEQSVAGLLQAQLPEAAGQPVAVRNAGIDGWGPSHYLLRARSVLPREPFGLVIVAIYVGNDAVPVRLDYVEPRAPVERARFHLPRALDRASLVDAFLRPANDALEVRSHLYTLAKNRLGTLRMRAGFSPLYLPDEFLRSEAGSDRWSILGDVSEDIADVAAEHGAKTLFVLIPAAFQVDEATFDQYVRGFAIDPAAVDLEQPTSLISEQLSKRGLQVLDALPAFRAAHSAGLVLYGRVDPHLTPEGHRILADLVAPAAASVIDGHH